MQNAERSTLRGKQKGELFIGGAPHHLHILNIACGLLAHQLQKMGGIMARKEKVCNCAMCFTNALSDRAASTRGSCSIQNRVEGCTKSRKKARGLFTGVPYSSTQSEQNRAVRTGHRRTGKGYRRRESAGTSSH